MSRPFFVLIFLALALQVSQAQMFSHGAPASVLSPTPDGRQHGAPASVVSPTPLPFGVHPPLRSVARFHGPLRRFGNQRSRRQVFVPVPVFYSDYGDGSYPSVADPSVPDATADSAASPQAPADRSDDELRAAYLQGARDALRQDEGRSGQRANQQPTRDDPKPAQRSRPDETSAAPPVDNSPATVFIFKDGHQLETRNYAIMGGTLFDFSSKVLKKIQIGEIDSAATEKANDDRGVIVKLD
jgi:hypothetical protein